LRNALLPVVTVIGLEFAFLIGGLVVTEQVFNINGIGKLFVDATAAATSISFRVWCCSSPPASFSINLAVDSAVRLARPAHPAELRDGAMATIATYPCVDTLPKRPNALWQFIKAQPLAWPACSMILIYVVAPSAPPGSRPSIPKRSILPPC
jgi:hypothetical protein